MQESYDTISADKYCTDLASEGKCSNRKMSGKGNVWEGKCLGMDMSGNGHVWEGKCLGREVSGKGNA